LEPSRDTFAVRGARSLTPPPPWGKVAPLHYADSASLPRFHAVDFQLPPTAQVQAASPASFHEQYEKAHTLANSGQPALALAAYNALLAQSPGNVDVLLGRGIVYTRMERWSEAQADLEAAKKGIARLRRCLARPGQPAPMA
jgi:predicted Zn-dependent protease